jgi:citrate synthase
MSGTAVPEAVYDPGLQNVIVAETRLSHVDGLKGELIIGGYPLEELAPNAHFEEAVYLLWHGELPTADELAEFQQSLAAQREVPGIVLELLRAAAIEGKPVMDALRMAAATLDLGAPSSEPYTLGARIVAALPTIVAAYWRFRQNAEPVAPRAELSHGENYLYMLTGEEPTAAAVRGLETYLNTVIDHGLNASTFATRVIMATQSDLVSAVTGALGALKGPLHGGAPGPALDMVFEIGSIERAEPFLREKLERGERLMGFGHRVYKVRDPRANVLAEAAEQFFGSGTQRELYELVKAVEVKAVELLEEYKPGRRLQTNVEFYTALLLHGLGFVTELFTPTFAIGRTAGWIAHAFEQQSSGRLIRPQSRYVGPHNRVWQR